MTHADEVKDPHQEISDKELAEVEERNLCQYFEIAIAIVEAHQSNRSLTSAETISTMKERSNVDLKN